ncbi:MAG: transaldolase family protein [Anaerobutyricum sp.]|nr:transaldolase family protein [Eubacterium sp.]MDY6046783.1 transaldolase family protein [Anaerobutyricum sp.]
MMSMKITLNSLGLSSVRGEEGYVERIKDMPVSLDEYKDIAQVAEYIGVTEQFKDIIATFHTPEGETPAGFRRELVFDKDKVIRVDLVRDISYDKNGILRPTNVLFSADSANPYEVAPISPLISNLTCNPGIIYDLFINNPKANVGNVYKNRDEVMAEIGRILGPGCDISVELNNPFEEDFNKILEEAEKFREMFSKYRVVIKVPHTGAVTPDNVNQLLTGNKKLDARYDQVGTENALRGHNLALKLHEHGFRVNFTLMFEPFQTLMALQARPYFINTFLRHRLVQSQNIQKYVGMYEASKDEKILEQLRDYFISCDYYTEADKIIPLKEVLRFGKDLIKYRHFEDKEGSDGLDGMRHNLRILRNSNLEDTRLIVCSMEGPYNYPDIDNLLAEPEFQDMNKKVVITAEPNYLARFTSTNQVISYQRRFMNAAKGQN